MLIMNLQNLQQSNGTLSMIKTTQQVVKEVKLIELLTLKAKLLKHFFCDYSDAYGLVKGDITATVGDANSKVAFKNCTLLYSKLYKMYNSYKRRTC